MFANDKNTPTAPGCAAAYGTLDLATLHRLGWGVWKLPCLARRRALFAAGAGRRSGGRCVRDPQQAGQRGYVVRGSPSCRRPLAGCSNFVTRSQKPRRPSLAPTFAVQNAKRTPPATLPRRPRYGSARSRPPYSSRSRLRVWRAGGASWGSAAARRCSPASASNAPRGRLSRRPRAPMRRAARQGGIICGRRGADAFCRSRAYHLGLQLRRRNTVHR
jgi:hypothetical protein